MLTEKQKRLAMLAAILGKEIESIKDDDAYRESLCMANDYCWNNKGDVSGAEFYLAIKRAENVLGL